MATTTELQQQLIAAGVNPAQIPLILSNPSWVALIQSHPQLANTWAERFPSSGRNVYGEKEVEWGLASMSDTQGLFGGPDAMAQNLGAVATSETGALKYKNGVIVNPAELLVLFPGDAENIAGSPAWLRKIQEKWSPAKIKEWRKKLAGMGYVTSAEGGMDAELLDGLKLYHETRYLNGGKPIAMGPGTEGGMSPEDDQLTDVTSGPELRSAARSMIVQATGQKPSDEMVEFLEGRMRQEVKKAIKKGRGASRGLSRGAAKAEEEFLEMPETEMFMDQNEDIERNTQLKDSLIAVAQLVSGL